MAATDIATVFLDRELRIKQFTPSAQTIFNLCSTDLSRPLTDLNLLFDYTEIVTDAERVLAHLQPVQRKVSARERWYIARIDPFRTADRQIDGLILTFLDITAQTESENALRASEERFAFVRRSSGVGFWYCDLPFDVLQWDELVKAHFHLPADAAVTIQTFYDRLHPDDREPTRLAIERSIASRKPYETDYRTVNPDTGSVTWVRAIGRTSYATDGTPKRFDGVTLDVSDRKRAEQEVIRLAAESDRHRRLYETVLTNTPDFIYVFSLDHRVLYANEALIKMWGCGHEGAIGKTFLEIGYEPWHAEMHDREIDHVRATRQPVRGEVPFNGTNGRRMYDYIFVPVIGADGEVEAVAGTTRDVTERKQTEATLLDSEERLRLATEVAELGIWTWQPDGDVVAWENDRPYEIFGLTRTAPPITAARFKADFLHPEDTETFEIAFGRTIEFKLPLLCECRIRRADGDSRWVEFTGRMVDDKDNPRLIGTVQDITDRKNAEEAVRVSEARHSFMVALADTLRPLSDPIDVQAEASRMLGEYLGANRVVYFEIHGNDYVIERDYTAGVRPLAGRYPVAAFGPTLLAILLGGRTVIEPDATTEPDRSPSERAAFADIQVRGHVDVPLVKSGRFVAGMTVHVSDRRDWTGHEVALIEETAERTWAAVERARAEAALRASEERRRLALDAAELGAWHINLATNAFTTDERFRIIFAGTTEPMGYEQAFGAIHADDQGRVGNAVAAAIRPDAPAPYAEEYRVVHPDGSVRWVFAKGRARYDRDGAGRLVSFDGTVADITARKLIEDERERLVGQLREADRRKNEFLAILAHELRNPLAPIRNGLQLIRMAGASETIERARSMMERQLTQLVRLVDDLLDVSRVTSGKLELRRLRVELRAVIDAAVETTRPVIEEAGHELAVTMPDERIWVEGDMTRLSQVVSNLLNNSAKYMHRGGHVRLAVGLEDGMAVVSVADDGIGIPPAMLEKVFEMFTQVDRALEKTTGGLGIGLSLVKGLVEMHGGTVEARSEGEGRGSEFVVRLPVLSSVQQVKRFETDELSRSSSCCRILVADDNVDAAESMGLLLQLHGNEVITVHDGLKAIEVAETFRPDVILLDIGMPKLNGYETCRRIREQPWGKNAILIALTGWGQAEDKRRTREAGFDHHLVKPVDDTAVMKLLASRFPEQ